MSNSILSVSRDVFHTLGHDNHTACPVPDLLLYITFSVSI